MTTYCPFPTVRFMRQPTPLKRAIFESERTQREIAAEIGMDPSHLSRIVNGLHAADATRAAIAAALGRQVDDVFPPEVAA